MGPRWSIFGNFIHTLSPSQILNPQEYVTFSKKKNKKQKQCEKLVPIYSSFQKFFNVCWKINTFND